MKKLCIFITFLILSQIVWAADQNAFSPVKKVETIPYKAPESTLKEELCPRVDQLVQDPVSKNWAAPGGWATTSPSFFNELTDFAGAQWIGVSVGEIICVYTGGETNKMFPVALHNSNLVPAPTNNEVWSNDKGGYMDCKSRNVEDCHFFVQQRKQVKNVFDELNFKKERVAPQDE